MIIQHTISGTPGHQFLELKNKEGKKCFLPITVDQALQILNVVTDIFVDCKKS